MPLSGGGAAPEHNKGTADTGGDREESLRRVFPAPPRSPSPLDFDLFLFIPSGQRSSGTPRGCGSPLMALLPCALRFVLGTALIYGSPGSARVRLRSPPLPPPTPHHNHHHHGERAAVASGGFNQEEEVPGESTAACRAVLAALFTQAGARALGLSRGQQGRGGGAGRAGAGPSLRALRWGLAPCIHLRGTVPCGEANRRTPSLVSLSSPWHRPRAVREGNVFQRHSPA